MFTSVTVRWFCAALVPVTTFFVAGPARAQASEGSRATSACGPVAEGAAPQAFVRAAEPSADGTLVVTLCLVGPSGATRIGSYRGEVRFDSTRVEVVKVDPGAGGMRTENSKLPGRLLFAGASPSGFTDPVMLRATVRLLRGERVLPPITLRMGEIWSVAGGDLSRQAQVSGYPRSRTTSAGTAAPGHTIPPRSTALASSAVCARDAFASAVSRDSNAHRAF